MSDTAPGPIPKPVLVVDDDPALLRLMQLLLEDDGFDVRAAPDGGRAIEALSWHRPVVVVLDYLLPDMGASELAMELRVRCGSALPIVLVTSAEGVEAKAQQVGAVAYLRKPFDLEELSQAVRSALRDAELDGERS